MKVLNLRCAHGHGFEGWFGSDDEFLAQNGRGEIACPLCADHVITRLPSAPRLNLGRGRGDAAADESTPRPPATTTPTAAPLPADLQAAWLAAARQLLARTEDVGDRFADEARRIHYGEAEARGIRGHTTAEEREALHEEGIEVVSLPLPEVLKGPLQ